MKSNKELNCCIKVIVALCIVNFINVIMIYAVTNFLINPTMEYKKYHIEYNEN